MSYIRWERVPETGVPIRYYPVPPDLAVEVVSPDDRAAEVRAKARDYIAAGVQQVWILGPDEQAITVQSTSSTQELGADDELDGGDLLPGFRVRVADLFQVRRQR